MTKIESVTEVNKPIPVRTIPIRRKNAPYSSALIYKCLDFKTIKAVLMRERFDKNKDVDLSKAKYLLEEGEKEFFYNMHYQPIRFPNSATGGAYNREGHTPDWVLDYWHPLEKAMYPKYFARREQMKDEYEEWYYKQYPEEKEKKISDH